MARPLLPHLRPSAIAFLSSSILLPSSFSCVTQPKVDGMTPADAQAVAIRAVRTVERDSRLELQPFDTQRTPDGDYAVYLQRKTTSTTADHWRVLVRPNRSAEVLPGDPLPTTPDTLPAHPVPLRGDLRETTPPAPEPILTGPRE